LLRGTFRRRPPPAPRDSYNSPTCSQETTVFRAAAIRTRSEETVPVP
jgi:hypothetical protein